MRARHAGPWLHVAILCAAVAACYANSLPGQFVFDDVREILHNPRIRSLAAWPDFLWRRRGLVELTLAVNFRLGGVDPRGYHILNAAFHAIATCLVYALARRLLALTSGHPKPERAGSAAFLVALVFAVHPLQTAAVTYVIQRAEILSAIFHLAALVLFLRSLDPARGGSSAPHWVAAGLAALLAMMAKEVGVATPFAVLLADLAIVSRWRPARLLSRWPLYGLLLGVLFVFLARSTELWLPPAARAAPAARERVARAARTAAPTPATSSRTPARPRTIHEIPTAGFGVEDVTPAAYWLTQPQVIAHYLRLYFLPVGLTFDYGWPPVRSPWTPGVIAPLLLLLLMAGVAVAAARRQPLFTFAIGWFFVALAPTSSFVPLRDLAFEHRMYLPVAALSLLVVGAGTDLFSHLHRERTGAALAVAWSVILAVLTVGRNAVYHDRLTFFRDSARKAPWNWRPHYDVGNELMTRAAQAYAAGDQETMERLYREAAQAFRVATEAGPEHGPPHIHLALLLRRWGRFREAERELLAATRARERSVVAMAWYQLGELYLQQGRREEAIRAFGRAADLMPQWAAVRARLQALGYTQGDDAP